MRPVFNLFGFGFTTCSRTFSLMDGTGEKIDR